MAKKPRATSAVKPLQRKGLPSWASSCSRARLGFKAAVIPETQAPPRIPGLELLLAKRLRDALDHLFK